MVILASAISKKELHLFERVVGFFNAVLECGARDTENTSLTLFKLYAIIKKFKIITSNNIASKN